MEKKQKKAKRLKFGWDNIWSERAFSPSSLERSLNSPGSMFLPPVKQQFSAAAEKGTKLHSIAEEKILGKKVDRRGLTDFEIDFKTKAYVKFCKKYIKSGGYYMLEEKSLMRVEDTHIGGTVDFAHFGGDRTLTVCDLKTGNWPVQAIDNKQLICYASLILINLRRRFNWDKMLNVNNVDVVIVQNDDVRVWNVRHEDIKDFGAELGELYKTWKRYKGVPRDKLPESLFRKGDHCRFCPDKLNCCERQENLDFLEGL